jgi:hypothetical protein
MRFVSRKDAEAQSIAQKQKKSVCKEVSYTNEDSTFAPSFFAALRKTYDLLNHGVGFTFLLSFIR